MPVVEVHLSDIDEREEWRRHSVLEESSPHRDRRQGPGRLPRSARVARRRRGVNARDRASARARSSEPLLVTNLVERPLPDRARELERGAARRARARRGSSPTSATSSGAQAVDGVEVVETAATSSPSSPSRCPAAIAVRGRPRHLRRARDACAPAARARADDRVVEALRAVKDAGELDAIRRGARVADRAFERLARGARSSGAPSASSRGGWSSSSTSTAPTALAFPTIVAAGPNGASPHAEPGDRAIEARRDGDRRRRRTLDGYCSDCTRTFADRRALRRGSRRPTTLCLEAQLRALEAIRPGVDGERGRRASRATRHRRRRATAALRPRARPRRRAGGPRGAALSPESHGHARARQRGHGRAGHLPRRAGRGADRGPRRRHARTASSC